MASSSSSIKPTSSLSSVDPPSHTVLVVVCLLRSASLPLFPSVPPSLSAGICPVNRGRRRWRRGGEVLVATAAPPQFTPLCTGGDQKWHDTHRKKEEVAHNVNLRLLFPSPPPPAEAATGWKVSSVSVGNFAHHLLLLLPSFFPGWSRPGCLLRKGRRKENRGR